MAPLARAHATLRITHDEATSSDVTTRLGLAPTDAHDHGDLRPRNLPPWRNMQWSLSSGPTDSRPLSDHLKTLLNQVEPVAEAVHQLASDDSMMDWFCSLDVEGGQGGEALEPDLLARLGALPIALSLDFYTGGDDR